MENEPFNAGTPALQAIVRQTLADHVVEKVRESIIRGDIAEGAMIGEVQLSSMLGVSRVPVREALIELAHDGILSFDKRGRAWVKHFTKHDYEEVISLRLTLESMSVRLAAERLTADDVTAMSGNIAAMQETADAIAFSRLDTEFHELIVRAAGHGRLLACWETMSSQFAVLLARVQKTFEQASIEAARASTTQDHQAILQALKTHDAGKAERAMQRHINSWREWEPTLVAG
ncbi:MAG: transcriptional regulator, GntR family [Verrucomicrobiaceae bacterium]|nr:transcriptional regulator, GntR family [Verrucomicrobiaceae bacterium]